MSCNEGNKNCSCTYTSCSRHGNCCQCVSHHNTKGEIPGCFFSVEGEKLHNRSLAAFMKDRG